MTSRKLKRQAEQAKKDIEFHRRGQDHHRGQYAAAQRRLVSLVSEQLGVPTEDLVLGSWNCPDKISDYDRKRAKKDPFFQEYIDNAEKRYAEAAEKNFLGYCVYNDKEDRCHDHCLFCGDPSERK